MGKNSTVIAFSFISQARFKSEGLVGELINVVESCLDSIDKEVFSAAINDRINDLKKYGTDSYKFIVEWYGFNDIVFL